jgi:hypothetical protein
VSIYDDLQKTAGNMLGQFGQSLTITSKSVGAYDPATGASIVTGTTKTGIGAIFDYGTKDIDGQLVLQGDKKLILSQIGIDNIDVDDTVTIGSKVYTVIMVKEINPGGTNVMYICQLRQ